MVIKTYSLLGCSKNLLLVLPQRSAPPMQKLFQPTAAVEISWWASSLLMEYTKDKSPPEMLEKGQHSKSYDLDTKNMFYLPVIYDC